MRIINDELYDEDPSLGATPELLTGNGAPEGDVEPQASAPKGSIYVQMDALDDTMPLWVKIDASGTDEDWVRILAERCSDDDVEIRGDWLWADDHAIDFRGSGGEMASPNPSILQITPSTYLRIGGATDYHVFNAKGMSWAAGDAMWHAEETYPVGTWLEAPGGSPPDYVTLENMAGASFDIGDEIYLVWRVPWGYNLVQSPEVQIELVWYINEAYALNNGEVQWRAEINAVTTDETEAVDTAGTEGSYDSGDQDIPATAKYLTLSTIDVTDEIEPEEMVGIKLSRIALDAGANPTADPVVVLVHLRYESGMVGRGLDV